MILKYNRLLLKIIQLNNNKDNQFKKFKNNNYNKNKKGYLFQKINRILENNMNNHQHLNLNQNH